MKRIVLRKSQPSATQSLYPLVPISIWEEAPKSASLETKHMTTKTVTGIPVSADTPVYQGREAGEDISPRIVAHLAANVGNGFSETMLASALGYTGEDGSPQQQRINGPMRKLAERIAESGEQPEGVPEGHVLKAFQQNDGKRVVKTWAIVEA